jgi:hypothetical protein
LLVFTVIPWSKLLINTFCSSLGSTLLFIESTTIHPLYLWVIKLVQCCYLDSTRIMCMLRRAYFTWWCVSKTISCELWRDFYNSQGADFGASQVVSELRFCRYPRVRSACRITLPMVVVESSVQTILLKMRWIVLISSAFYSLPMCFSPLTFASFESSLLPSSSFRILRGWTISYL